MIYTSAQVTLTNEPRHWGWYAEDTHPYFGVQVSASDGERYFSLFAFWYATEAEAVRANALAHTRLAWCSPSEDAYTALVELLLTHTNPREDD
jgi:hypothetical protein